MKILKSLSAGKKPRDISILTSDVSYDIRTINNDRNLKKTEDITTLDAPNTPATITPSPSHTSPNTPDAASPNTTTPISEKTE